MPHLKFHLPAIDFTHDTSICHETHILHPLSAFLSALLKDIKSERPKITEKDNLRLLFVTKWFLEFFLASRAKASSAASRLGVNTAKRDGETEKWEFGLIAEVIERGWIVWVLKRMREAVEEKVHDYAIPLI